MTVEELITFLKSMPPKLEVAYEIHSEHCVLEEGDIRTKRLSVHRDDGWVHDLREDRPSQLYVVFPGN